MPSSLPEQVVITASPLTNDPNAIAVTVGSVDRNQILQLGGANIADVLRDLPGVSATTFASGASRPVIRGFDASRVRILEDGVGTFDVSGDGRNGNGLNRGAAALRNMDVSLDDKTLDHDGD